jgi:uncharacterized protein (TIGR02266 family)
METPMTLVMPLVRIKLKCPTLDAFVDKYQDDVNSVGIFVRTRSPLAAGTPIRFDFRLGDDSCLFRGNGTVVWSRQDETLAPLLEAGMMLSFDELHDGTRQTFDYVLARARTFAAAAETAPTIVRTLDAVALDAAAAEAAAAEATAAEAVTTTRRMPETTKLTADQVEELRARMREGMVAERAAEPAPVEHAPEAPAPPATPLAKILVMRPAAPEPTRPSTPVVVDVDLDNLAQRDITALVDVPRRRPARSARLLGYGLAGWMLVLAYVLFVMHWMSRR